MNSLGEHFVFTSFGESHGKAIGGVLDGVPGGVRIDMDMIREALDKRAGRVKGDEARGEEHPKTPRAFSGTPLRREAQITCQRRSNSSAGKAREVAGCVK